MRIVRILAVLLLSITVLGCSTTAPHITPEQVSEPEIWGAAKHVTKLRHLYFSDQPDEDALQIAKERDVKIIINLREPAEYEWDEENASKSLDLTYYNVPIAKTGAFSPEAIRRIDALVKSHPNEKILIHCSSGNRAAGWLAVHLVSQHQLETSEALDIAKEAGITKEGINVKVRSYVSEHIHGRSSESSSE